MLKQAGYYESVGLFEKAKTYYHHAFSLCQDESKKAEICLKISHSLTTQAQQFTTKAEEYEQRAIKHDLFNYNLVDESFIQNLIGVDLAVADHM